MESISMKTWGCPSNKADSKIIESKLKKRGFELKSIDESDLVILNTCWVKEPTQNKIINMIKKLRASKQLIIAGCAPEIEPERFRKLAPSASLISARRAKDISKAVKKALAGKRVELLGKPKVDDPCPFKKGFYHILRIAQGCLSNCSYCCTKLARGHLCSRSLASLIKEASNSIDQGAKELWLTSQDNSCWGLDSSNGYRLPDLIEKIASLQGKFRLRIGMLNPSHLEEIDDLIKAYQSKKVYKFLHLPVQSGSNEILQKMQRGYSVEDFVKIVRSFRKEFPRLNLWTDMICGFPSESEQDFLESCKLVKKIKPDWVNISRFGPRPKTIAAEMEQLSSVIKKERSKKLSSIVRKAAEQANKKWLGKSCEVLFYREGKKASQLVGRNESYKSVVVKAKKQMGGFAKVRIIKAGQFLYGFLENP